MKIAKRPQTEKVRFSLIEQGQCFWYYDELHIKTEEGIAFFKGSIVVNTVRLRDGLLDNFREDCYVIPENNEEVVFNKE